MAVESAEVGRLASWPLLRNSVFCLPLESSLCKESFSFHIPSLLPENLRGCQVKNKVKSVYMNSRRKIKPATMHTEEQAEGIELEIGRKLEARKVREAREYGASDAELGHKNRSDSSTYLQK